MTEKESDIEKRLEALERKVDELGSNPAVIG